MSFNPENRVWVCARASVCACLCQSKLESVLCKNTDAVWSPRRAVVEASVHSDNKVSSWKLAGLFNLFNLSQSVVLSCWLCCWVWVDLISTLKTQTWWLTVDFTLDNKEPSRSVSLIISLLIHTCSFKLICQKLNGQKCQRYVLFFNCIEDTLNFEQIGTHLKRLKPWFSKIATPHCSLNFDDTAETLQNTCMSALL